MTPSLADAAITAAQLPLSEKTTSGDDFGSSHPRSVDGYIRHVDGIRALAVVSVIAYHFNPALLPGGFGGVDIFFVISGYIVSAAMAKRQPESPLKFVLGFYSRRFLRILPALFVCLSVTALLTATLLPDAWLSGSTHQTGIYAFFGLSNFVLASSEGDYFSPISEFNPFTHTWSLGVEEQFYLIFPALFFFWTTRNAKSKKLSLALFALFGCASLWWGAVRAGQPDAYYLIMSRFWQLATGVLTFQVLQILRPQKLSIMAWPALIMLVGSLVLSQAGSFPFPGAIPLTAATALLLAALQEDAPSRAKAILGTPAFVHVGKLSYSLYLWHWPVFVLARWTVGLEGWYGVAALLVTAISGSASYYLVERPLRTSGLIRRLPRLAIVTSGIVLVSAGAILANQVNENRFKISINPVMQSPSDWYPYGDNQSPFAPGCEVLTSQRDLVKGYVLTFERGGCGPSESPRRIFSVGDSHTMAFSGLFKELTLRTGATSMLFQNGGCPFLSLQRWRETSEHCKEASAASLNSLLSLAQPGDIILLASLRLPRLTEQWESFSQGEIEQQWQSFEEDLSGAVTEASAVIDSLAKTGANVVIEEPLPIFRTPPFRCAAWYNAPNEICKHGFHMSASELEAMRAPVVDALRALTPKLGNVFIWDPLPSLCSEEGCSAVTAAGPLFFDADHISGFGNQMLVEPFMAGAWF